MSHRLYAALTIAHMLKLTDFISSTFLQPMTCNALYSVRDRRCLPKTNAILYHVGSVDTDSSLTIVSSSIVHVHLYRLRIAWLSCSALSFVVLSLRCIKYHDCNTQEIEVKQTVTRWKRLNYVSLIHREIAKLDKVNQKQTNMHCSTDYIVYGIT